VADEDGECIGLVVLDAPVRLTGAVGRLVNPFLRT
jgi:putative transcriptional regulator